MENPGPTVHCKASDDRRLKRDIGTVGLLFAAVGSIIGSGWLFGALIAAQIAGPASIIAWGLGGVMVIMIGLCYTELSTMLPVSGSVVHFAHFALARSPATHRAGSPSTNGGIVDFYTVFARTDTPEGKITPS